MRVSTNMVFNSIIDNLMVGSKQLLDKQEVINTNKRINRPSDDPVGMAQTLNYNQVISSSVQYQRNITQASSWLNQSDTSFQNMTQELQLAQTIAINQSNDTASADSRAASVDEVNGVINSINDLINGKLGDRYLFSGKSVKTAAYSVYNKGMEYNGDLGNLDINISSNIKTTVNTPGAHAFPTSVTDLGEAANLSPDVVPVTRGFGSSLSAVDSGFDFVTGNNDQMVFTETIARQGASPTRVFQHTVSLTDPALGGTLVSGQTYDGKAVGDALTRSLNSTNTSSNTYQVTYDKASSLFTITNNAGNRDQMTLDWSDPNNTSKNTLGFTTAADQVLNPGGSDTADSIRAFNVMGGVNDTFFADIDGSGAHTVAIAAGNYMAPELAQEMKTEINAAMAGAGKPGRVDVTYRADTGLFDVQSLSLGAGSNVVLSPAGSKFLGMVNMPPISTAGLGGTALSLLNQGAGVQPGMIKITDKSGDSRTLDVTGLKTLQDVVDGINNLYQGAGPGQFSIQAEYNQGYTGVNLVDASTANGMIKTDEATGQFAFVNDPSGHNDQIVFNDGASHTINLVAGGWLKDNDLNTGAGVATAIQNAMNSVNPASQYNVSYDEFTSRFTVAANAGNPHTVSIDWQSSTAGNILGFAGPTDTIPAGSGVTGQNNALAKGPSTTAHDLGIFGLSSPATAGTAKIMGNDLQAAVDRNTPLAVLLGGAPPNYGTIRITNGNKTTDLDLSKLRQAGSAFISSDNGVNSDFIFAAGQNDVIRWDPGTGGGPVNLSLIIDGGLSANTYHTGDEVAQALQQGLNNTSGGRTFTVSYDKLNSKFNILANDGATNCQFLWSDLQSTAGSSLGFASNTVVAPHATDTSQVPVAFNVVKGLNDTFQISVDGGASAHTVTVNVPSGGGGTGYTGDGLAQLVNNTLSAAVPPIPAKVNYDHNVFTFAAGSQGHLSQLSLAAGTANSLLAGMQINTTLPVANFKTSYGTERGTVGDLIDALNGANMNLAASINPDQAGVQVVSTLKGTILTIADINGGNTATQLGIAGLRDVLTTPVKPLGDGSDLSPGISLDGAGSVNSSQPITQFQIVGGQAPQINSAVTTDSNFVFTAGANDSISWDPDGAGPAAATVVSLITDGGLTSGQAYSGQDVAAALKKALESTATGNDTYDVQYDLSQNKFNVTNTAGNSNPISINWTNAGSTAANVLGFATDSNLAVGQQATADAARAFNIIAGTNDQFQITSNPPGGPALSITVPAGNYTGGKLVTAIQAGLDTGFGGRQVSVAFTGAGFNFINQDTGNASTLNLSSPAGNTLLGSLGLPAGNYNATGSGSGMANNVLYLSEDNGVRGISVNIPAGNYTNWQLANTIQKQLDGANSPLKGTYTVAVDDPTGTFSINETTGQHTFALDKSRGTADETLGFTANQAGYGSVRKSDTPAYFSMTVPANSSFLLTVDGINSDPIKIDPGRYDSNALMREIYSKINGDPGAVPPIPGDPKLAPLNNVQVNYDPKVGFVLKSGTSGHNSTITVAPDNITPGAADFLQTISLDSSTARHGVDSTRLADLNSGAGVGPGKVAFTDMSGDTATIDFSQAVTVQDVVNAINNYGEIHAGSNFSLKASLSGNNKNLVLTDAQPAAKGVIQVQEGSAGTQTAKDLGLLGVSNEGVATYTGTDL
ncbi:MAG: flagellar hook-associated protein FlgL, partial [Deltaproteobacteria bacterium]|nr:flagellar hook-associated protein FlgL [Deltaproteobacteria bacterium]